MRFFKHAGLKGAWNMRAGADGSTELRSVSCDVEIVGKKNTASDGGFPEYRPLGIFMRMLFLSKKM
jgi:hypothetical protein